MKCTLDTEMLLFQSIVFVEWVECLIFLLQFYFQVVNLLGQISPVNVTLCRDAFSHHTLV